MESKVLLFNEENTRVGETFMRRARQLVSQQRAEWTDESHSAIRFAPDADILAAETAEAETKKASSGKTDRVLYALAEKRIKDRRNFIIHSIVVLPLWFFILGVIGGSEYEWEMAMFLFGVSLTLYAVHFYGFFEEHIKNFRLNDRRERHARSLAIEMDKLRRMGYSE